MRWRLPGACALLAVLAAAALLVPTGSAQDFEFGSPQATNMSPSVLYLKSNVADTSDGRSSPESAVCQTDADPTNPIYGMAATPPASQEPDRVYDVSWTAHGDCSVSFQYQVQEPFTLSRGATASVSVNCHRPTPVAAPASGGEQEMTWGFSLYRNGEEVSNFRGTDRSPGPGGLGGLCYEATAPDHVFHGIFEPGDVVFQSGDTLQLAFWWFNPVSPGNTTHIKVDGWNGPSALYGIGLPGTVRPSPGSTLGAEPLNTTAQAGPANETTIRVPIRNDGNSSRTVQVDIQGPADWPKSLSTGSLQVPAGGTASLKVTVAAPPDAVPNATANHQIILTSQGEELVFETTTRAVPGTGSPTDLVSTDEEQGDDGAALEPGSLTESGDAETASEDGGLAETVSEIWVEVLATAIVATIAAVVGVVWD